MDTITEAVISKARERGLKQALTPGGRISKDLINALDYCVFSSTRIYFVHQKSQLNSRRRDYSKELNLILGLADVKVERVDCVPADDSYYKVSHSDLKRLKLLILENTDEWT